MLHCWIIIFCAKKIFSVGISMPRSPRATMMASLFSKMSSKFCRPSWFSTLLMIFICRPLGPSTCAQQGRLTCLPVHTMHLPGTGKRSSFKYHALVTGSTVLHTPGLISPHEACSGTYTNAADQHVARALRM